MGPQLVTLPSAPISYKFGSVSNHTVAPFTEGMQDLVLTIGLPCDGIAPYGWCHYRYAGKQPQRLTQRSSIHVLESQWILKLSSYSCRTSHKWRQLAAESQWTSAVLRLECSLVCISGSVGHQQNIFRSFSHCQRFFWEKKCNYKKCNWVSGSPSILYTLVLGRYPSYIQTFKRIC